MFKLINVSLSNLVNISCFISHSFQHHQAYAMAANHRSKEKQLRNIYRPLLKQKVKTGQVVPYLLSINSDILPKGTDRDLRAEARDQPSKTVEVLLDVLIAHDVPGWFSAFITALEKAGYRYLSELLLGYRDLEDDSFAHKLINMFLPELMNVNCVNIMPYLRQSECITDDDCEAIRTYQKNHCVRSAALYMIQEHLGNKSKDVVPEVHYCTE